MQINYIILAHQQPKQVRRLVEALTDTDCFFHIHIDKAVDMQPFVSEVSHLPNVRFVSEEKRENSVWGDIGLVKATLSVLGKIVEECWKGYCVLLSGQHYPLKNKKQIKSILWHNYGANYISTFPLPTTEWENEGLDRLLKYKINLSVKRQHSVLLSSIYEKDFYTRENFKSILRLIKRGRFGFLAKIFKRRTFPRSLKPYGGEHWWMLPIETIKNILWFLESHPGYINYHRHTLLAEEIFFHSIVMFIKNEVIHNMIVKSALTYINWTDPSIPATFTKDDYEELRMQTGEYLFARKFDAEVDEDILDLIDESLLQRSMETSY
jgi:hypothetical protein